MIRWIIYVSLILIVTSCKSIKKIKKESYSTSKTADSFSASKEAEDVSKFVFSEEIEEETIDTFTVIQTDSGSQVVPIKRTIVKRRTQAAEELSESDSESVSNEFVLFKAEADLDVDKSSEESEAPAKIVKSIFSTNLTRIISILLTVSGAFATWYFKRKKSPEDQGLG